MISGPRGLQLNSLHRPRPERKGSLRNQAGLQLKAPPTWLSKNMRVDDELRDVGRSWRCCCSRKEINAGKIANWNCIQDMTIMTVRCSCCCFCYSSTVGHKPPPRRDVTGCCNVHLMTITGLQNHSVISDLNNTAFL